MTVGVAYRECTFCVMDTSDPQIRFDADGRCNHCVGFETLRGNVWLPGDEGKQELARLTNNIKRQGVGREYDCILGLSGGTDSSFLALKALEWGLRPLVVHVDGGWNTELAVQNIQRIVQHCGYELHTKVIDWSAMRDLQLAYLAAGVANQDVPQDHAIFSSLYSFAVTNGIRFVLNGGNVATEGIDVKAWQGAAMDSKNLRSIYRAFGRGRLKNFPTVGMLKYYLWYPYMRRMSPVRLLNYMDYNTATALSELTRTVGWRAYPRKHGESVFTKFFQNYYLPLRFGYDKRRPHLSSRICSGELTRSEAVEELSAPLYEVEELERDLTFICKKLRISREDMAAMMSQPLRYHSEFDNWEASYGQLKRVQSVLARTTGSSWTTYSR